MAQGVIKRGDQAQCFTVVGASFNSKSALPDRRQHNLRCKNFRYFFAGSQTTHTRCSKNNRVKFTRGDLSQPRIHVPAQVERLKIRAVMEKLRLSPKAAGANSRAHLQVPQSGPVA